MIFDICDPDDRARQRCRWINVWLNGADITNSCIMVDDVRRVIVRQVQTLDGQAQRDPKNPQQVWIEELRLKRSDSLKVSPKVGIPPELRW